AHAPTPQRSAAVGQPRGVRGTARGGGGSRVRRRDVRAAGAILLPGRPVVRPSHRAAGRCGPGTVTAAASSGDPGCAYVVRKRAGSGRRGITEARRFLSGAAYPYAAEHGTHVEEGWLR